MTLVLCMLPVFVAASVPLIVSGLRIARVPDLGLGFSIGALIGLMLLTLALAINTRSTTGA